MGIFLRKTRRIILWAEQVAEAVAAVAEVAVAAFPEAVWAEPDTAAAALAEAVPAADTPVTVLAEPVTAAAASAVTALEADMPVVLAVSGVHRMVGHPIDQDRYLSIRAMEERL